MEYQPARGMSYMKPTIIVESQRLQVVDKFTYLGSTLSRVVHIDDEVNARIAKSTVAFGIKWNQTWHKAENVQICVAANTIACMRNSYSLLTACQKTKPYKLP